MKELSDSKFSLLILKKENLIIFTAQIRLYYEQ